MNYILSWDKLLSNQREREKSETSDNDYRHDFESDYDRVVFSSPFRRLQDKAQVFPLERNDFVRTRLTHSMEVAALARSMGVSISKKMLKNGYISNEEYASYIPVILETAGMAHDIGNPPFGHYGEETIKKTFSKWFDKQKEPTLDKEKELTLDKKKEGDFLHFDGNSQMFRILTHLQCIKDPYGMNLTYATLATLMKYPFSSEDGNKESEYCDIHGSHYKKFGYYFSEKDVANRVLKATGLTQNSDTYRHPLAFVLEAADDIAYSAADLEDGYKKKLFSFEDIKKYFLLKGGENSCTQEAHDVIERILKGNMYYSDEKKLQDIRIKLQGLMVEKVVDAFIDNYDGLMNCQFKGELLYKSEAGEIRARLKRITNDFIFSDQGIIKTELGGEKVITCLIDSFLNAFARENFIFEILGSDKDLLSASQKRMYSLISEDFKKVFEQNIEEIKRKNLTKEESKKEVLYYIYLLIVDYISGMTDNYCTELYKKLQGMSDI